MSDLIAATFVVVSYAALLRLGRYVYCAERRRQVLRLYRERYAELAKVIGEALLPAFRSVAEAMSEIAATIRPALLG